MKYDFTSLMNRSGHDSIAVDRIPIPGAEVKEGFSRIPMWVADMNFPSLPTIQEAIHARVNEPHFGYFDLPDAYFDNIIRWQKERNGVEDLPREAIGYENGVLGCVASAAAAFTSPGESILLHSPTYFCWLFTLIVIAAFADMVAGTFNAYETIDGVTKLSAQATVNGAAGSISLLFIAFAVVFERLERNGTRPCMHRCSFCNRHECTACNKQSNLDLSGICLHLSCRCPSDVASDAAA